MTRLIPAAPRSATTRPSSCETTLPAAISRSEMIAPTAADSDDPAKGAITIAPTMTVAEFNSKPATATTALSAANATYVRRSGDLFGALAQARVIEAGLAVGPFDVPVVEFVESQVRAGGSVAVGDYRIRVLREARVVEPIERVGHGNESVRRDEQLEQLHDSSLWKPPALPFRDADRGSQRSTGRSAPRTSRRLRSAERR
jgi:hypothetical protein